MSIEDEAKKYSHRKLESFENELKRSLRPTETLLINTLHDSVEREYVLKYLQSTVLWAKHCVDKHGMK